MGYNYTKVQFKTTTPLLPEILEKNDFYTEKIKIYHTFHTKNYIKQKCKLKAIESLFLNILLIYESI